jgi:hypothetical protein
MTEDGTTPQPDEPFPNAEAVIDAFGGVRPMASQLGVAATTIQGWKSRGNIPENRRQEVRDKAAEAGIDLASLPIAPAEADPSAAESQSAEDVAVEHAAEPVSEPVESGPPPVAPQPVKSGGQGLAWLALVAAVAVGAALLLQPRWAPVVYGNGGGGSSPSVPSEILDRLAALEAKPAMPSLAPVTARLDALDAAVKSMPKTVESGPDLTPRLEELTATLDRRAAQLDALSARLDQTAGELRGSAQGVADSAKAEVAALRGEVASLRTALEELRAREAAATGRTTGFALAVVSLEQALRRGAPYANALAAVKRLAGDAPDIAEPIAVLEPDAATGIPSAAELERRFASLAPALGEPLWSETGVGWADKVLRKIDAVVSIRRTEDSDGKATPARQAERAVAAGDLEAAVTALEPAPGPAAGWLETAKRRVAAEKAVATLRLQAVELLGKGMPAAGVAQ